MSDYYTDLKYKNDILEVAFELGYNGSRAGKCYQGECPKHPSAGGKCLVIWPGIQGYRCYHQGCGEKGDIINLAMLYKKLDHRGAVNYLADRVEMPHLGGKNLSPQEVTQREADLSEKTLVEEMLTKATEWYHIQLQNFPDIVDHLEKHYGFSKDIIDELQIGFAPPGTSHPDITSDLANYLDSIPAFHGKLALSGLFTFQSPQGSYWDFFKGRIIFPYWKNGKVVYMAARATDQTPVDQYECYTDSDGNIRKDDQGNPDRIKYKKIRTHDPEDEKRKYISRFIQNDCFMGEDSIRGTKVVIITEGAPDVISAIDKSFAAISPVTTQFREKDFEKLERLTVGADSINIINDNEDNKAGLEGAIKTGKYLTKAGRNVFLVELPKPTGASKIDLNEYLVNHTADDLRKLMEEANSVLDLLIEGLPEDFPKALPAIKSDIAPILADLEGGIFEHYIEAVKKRTKTTRQAMQAEIDMAKKERASKQAESTKDELDPEIKKMAEDIAHDPLLLRKRIDIINEAGIVGERNQIAMYFAALDSRLLPDDRKSPNVLALKSSGHWGAGKSFSLLNCLDIYPEAAYHLITNGSAKSLYYLKEGLSHRALVLTEAYQFQANNAPDSEFVYVTRSLLSEGQVRYLVVEKDDEGKLVTVEKILQGPTSFITTTVLEKLEPQFEDRLFTIHPDESVDQTKGIITMTAEVKAGIVSELDKRSVSAWKAYHDSLQPVEVIMLFAPKIAEYIIKSKTIPIATRRAFKRVMTLIQTVACSYQYQRKRDDRGRVIAEIIDYYLAVQIVREAFRENLGQQSRESEERILYVQENGPVQYKALEEAWGITRTAISNWVRPRVTDDVLIWCDEHGSEFSDDNQLKKAKRSGKAYIKISDAYSITDITGLPSPYDLTGDPTWDKGGEFYEMYDLKLSSRSGNEVSRAIKAVLMEGIDTPDKGKPGDIVKDSGDDTEGIKVSSPNPEDNDQLSKELDSILKKTVMDGANSKNRKDMQQLTPYICQTGCKHYDRVKDVNDNKVKECCWREGTGCPITENTVCDNFESKISALPDGVLAFDVS